MAWTDGPALSVAPAEWRERRGLTLIDYQGGRVAHLSLDGQRPVCRRVPDWKHSRLFDTTDDKTRLCQSCCSCFSYALYTLAVNE